MGIFNFKTKNQKENTKLSFFVKKHKISFLAYELLKKFVISQSVSPDKLDFVFPQNWTPKVLKNLSPKARTTLYRLSDNYGKNKKGLICQNNNIIHRKKPLSSNATRLLKKINNNQPRYQKIDLLIKKYKINKVLS